MWNSVDRVEDGEVDRLVEGLDRLRVGNEDEDGVDSGVTRMER